MPSIQKNIQIFAALSLVEGIAAFLWLISLPTSHQIFSTFRLAGLVAILLLIIISAAVLISSRTPGSWPYRIMERTAASRSLLSFLLVTASVTLWVAILWKDRWEMPVSESTLARLLPLLTYVLLLCFQAAMLLLLSPHQRRNIDSEEWESIWKPALVLWGIFMITWALISFSKAGFIHDEVGLSWGPPGTPITFAQVQLVLAIVFLLGSGWYVIQSRLPGSLFIILPGKDLLIFLTLWVMTVVLWGNTPVSPTHFSPPPMPPNHEVYPNSDAMIFDRSSYHLLHGIGFSNQLARRPLYVGMLALFHGIAGPGYEDTVFLQILILGLIPPLVYLLTAKLSNRMAGLIAAGLILLREKNSMELSGTIVTSHAKLMMSDMIAMLGVILFLYVTVRWLSKKNRGCWEAAIAGACLGLTALVRAQVLVLAPLLLLFNALSRKSFMESVRASIAVLLGLMLVLSPWAWRNWDLTGTFVLDDRGEERLLARNYSLTPYSLPSPLTGETEEEFSARLKADILTFIRTHPTHVLSFVSNHFFRNLAVSSVYIAPLYSTDRPSALVDRLPFWNDWTGELTPGGGMTLIVNLTIVALGVGIAMSKNKSAGLFPLIAFLVYGLGNALVRTSGWRFILPVDWIILVYYSIALAFLSSKIIHLFHENITGRVLDGRSVERRTPVFQALVLSLLLLLGASVPIAERLIPATSYESFTESARTDLSDYNLTSPSEVDAFLAQHNAVLLSGAALYPRHVRPNSRIYLADAPLGYRYLHFWLMNEADHQVILPLQNSPDNIPHTAIVSVIGCREEDYISAFAVILHEPSSQVLVRDPGAPLQCPLAEPH